MNAVLLGFARFLAGFVGLCAVLGALAMAGWNGASFAYRLLMAHFLLGVCAAYGGTAAVVLRVVGRHRISQWLTARAFKWTMRLFTGVQFDVVAGQQHLHTRPAVFVGNHQTALDILMLGSVFPPYCSVTAKKQLRWIPLLGWYMALSGTVFIDRANRSTALRAFEGAAEEMRDQRQSVFIFPEGTRSNAKEPMLLPFKKGAFHLAVQAKVPIVPMVSACYWGVLSPKEWRFRQGRVPVVVLPPIPTHNLEPSDANELTIYVKNQMQAALEHLTRSDVGRQAWETNPPPRAADLDVIAANDKYLEGLTTDSESEGQIALKKKLGLAK